jgi:hypothetical protein
MTPHKRVMTALRGGYSDRIPFTVYENKIPQCFTERKLRNRGLCIVQRTTSYKIHYPNVGIKEYHYCDEKGRNLIQTVYSTPNGTLSTLEEPTSFTRWQHKYLFKTPDDYKTILYMIKDAKIEPCYGAAARLSEVKGKDFVVRDKIPLEPIQAIMLDYMGTETFCYEWMDNQDEILKLYNALVELNRKVYDVVANGPLEFANYGGNVTPQIIGVKNFEKYYVPNYNEAAEVLHKKGKLIGSHFDANNTLIMDAIGKTDLDYIEAFDPGMGPSVKEAQKAWPNKVLWINWPSSSHVLTTEEIRTITIKLIEEAPSGKNFIIGITEDVPEDRWQMNFSAIMDGIDSYGKLCLK